MNKNSNASMKVSSNVIIKTIDSNNKVVRVTKLHNKATMTMVTGILQFLSGAFSPVSTNPNINTTMINSARNYIPISMQLGTVGVKMTDRLSDKPKLLGINRSDFKTPTFDDYKLQQEVTQYYTNITDNIIKFDTASITSFDDANSSMGLLLQAKLPAGRLVGYGTGANRKYFTDDFTQDEGVTSPIPSGKGWVYYNTFTEQYEALFTEIGLVSDEGTLLARVLFDGLTTVSEAGEVIFDNDKAYNNPIIQSDTTSLVVEWRIGLVSIGPNDEIVSTSGPVPEVPPAEQLDILRSYIDGNNSGTIVDTLQVPDGVTTIRDYAFYGINNIANVILPEELTEIGDYAFDSMSVNEGVEKNLYYKGTQAQWGEINKGIDNTWLENATMHYNYIEE